MSETLAGYFQGEKAGGLLLVIAGAAAIVAGALLWRTSYRGAAIPLILVAVVQLAVGGAIYARTDRQVTELRTQLDRNPGAYRAAESARMQTVVRSLSAIIIVEVLLLITGVAMALVYKERPMVFASGLGLIGQAAFMLVFDLVAANRARAYLDAIKMLTAAS